MLQDGLGPNYGELGWLGRTPSDLVCFEGRRVSGLAGPTLCGKVSGLAAVCWETRNKEIKFKYKGQNSVTSE